MRRISAIVLSMIFVFLISLTAYAEITSFNVMIDDRASLFSEEEIELIDSEMYDFAGENNFSVAVVTTDDAMGKSAMEFADDYYDDLIFNSGWSEDGMCFLIDMDNREIYVSCAGLCIDEYTDYELNSIVDSGYGYVADGEYAECIVAMITEAENLAADSSDSDVYYYENGEWISGDNGYYNENDYYYGNDYYYDNDISYEPQQKAFNISHVFIYIIIGLVAGAITVVCVKNSYKNTGKGDEFNARDISLELTASNDNIISKNVITTKIPRNNNNHRHGGGGGGGVSVHRSSGGIRHSGAGRKF